MRPENRGCPLLELVPHGWSSRRFTIRRDGETVADLELAWLREGGAVTIGGEPFELSREGLVSGVFALSRVGIEVVRASKPSAWRERLEVTHEGATYELAKASWWGNAYDVRADGRAIGSIRPRHPFTRRSAVTMPEEFPLAVTVFIAALVVLMWNRQAGAAGG